MRLYYRIMRVLCYLAFLAGFRFRAYGAGRVPLHGPLLLASNHQSLLDPVLVGLALPREVHFMARDTLFRKPAFSALIRSLNAFPVKRGTADLSAVRSTLRLLEQGVCVTTFPESTRTHDGRVNPCQAGILVMARRAGVPIVPVAIEGAFDAWPRHRKLPHPGSIRVAYGEPIFPENLNGMDNEAAARLLTRRLRELHNELRHRMSREPWTYDEITSPC